MAWTYLAESEESLKPWNRGSEHSPTASRTTTQQPFCFHAWPEGKLEMPQSGTTCRPYGRTCSPPSTSSAEVFRARTSALRGMDWAWKENEAVFSTRSADLLARLEPPLFSWRTSQRLLLEEGFESLKNLPPWGMTVGGSLYQPQKSVRRTFANAGFVWPTPTASDFRGGEDDRGWSQSRSQARKQSPGFFKTEVWYEKTASELAGRTNGIPCIDYRNHALGNGVVPQPRRLSKSWQASKPPKPVED